MTLTLDRRQWIAALALIVSLAIGGLAVSGNPVAAEGEDPESGNRHRNGLPIKEFEVAENGTRFFYDEEPVFADGLPAPGNAFVTEGYIYPAGTLNGSNGVLPDGSPEFPKQVIGTWICRGFFIGDGMHTTSGPMVITTQIFNFGEEYGKVTLVTDGYELADVGVPIKRAITGGTGPLKTARGEVSQVLLGVNVTTGVVLRFDLNLTRF
jgi:hypothetical protein